MHFISIFSSIWSVFVLLELIKYVTTVTDRLGSWMTISAPSVSEKFGFSVKIDWPHFYHLDWSLYSGYVNPLDDVNLCTLARLPIDMRYISSTCIPCISVLIHFYVQKSLEISMSFQNVRIKSVSSSF